MVFTADIQSIKYFKIATASREDGRPAPVKTLRGRRRGLFGKYMMLSRWWLLTLLQSPEWVPLHGMLSQENASAFAHMMILPSDRILRLNQSPIGHKASACRVSWHPLDHVQLRCRDVPIFGDVECGGGGFTTKSDLFLDKQLTK
jgi:hypothetical protein